MRSILLASACCAFLEVAAAGQARAQGLPVIDTSAIAQAVANQVETIVHMVQEYQELQAQYQMMTNTYNAVSHGNNVLGTATGLLAQTTQLPGSAASLIPGLAFGSSVSGNGAPFLGQNQYYAPTDTDFAAQELLRKQAATANLQGEALIGMQTADRRIASLQQLQADIQAQPDITALEASAAHISSEEAFLSNEAVNVQRLQLLAQMQDRVDAQRAEESGRQDADQWHAFAAAAAFGP